MPRAEKFWLVKTEPESFSIQDLAAAADQTTCWDGVRNYQARNYLRDEMKLGDRVLFYHSGEAPAIIGTARVVREAYPDPTAWDKTDSHYDPQSKADNPRWFMVDLQLDWIFPRPLPLSELRQAKALNDMELLRKGSRLSVQPVTKSQFSAVLKLAAK